MKKIILYIVLILVFNSCTKECWQRVGDNAVEKRTLQEFNKIEILDIFKIHFIQDSLSYIVLKGKDNLIKNIETEVSNQTLTISDNNTCKLIKGYHDNHLYIHFKSLEYINLIGSSELYSEDSLYLDQIFINSNADVTKWNLKIKAQKLEIKLQSVIGELTLSGFTTYLYIYSSGRGHCFFKNLICINTDVNHSSQGDYYLTVKERVNISISKSGNVYCYGNPIERTVINGENSSGKVFFVDD